MLRDFGLLIGGGPRPGWAVLPPPDRGPYRQAVQLPDAEVNALRAHGVAALGDLSPSRVVAIARAARVPNFRTAPRRRIR
ncbi:MAG: hypothetical protein HOU81_27130 [Hamadaea sp.]|uniref:hypothetical protein n=1 Tax=Hamadaea sp. TaxID=2024425 RepID=UPI00183E9B48|nr:hypothetical protein [Hamadaea sp.]NUR74499.1 hypothetical protein [Hamadaea sp.]NUT21428.1 hypothetical protein [Hamadaea sp.]